MPETIPHDARSGLYNIRRAVFEKSMDTIADQLYRGRITLGMWEEDMRTRLRMYMVGAASIGKGGRDHMTSSDWGKVGAELKKQYRWLHGFAEDIYARRKDVTLDAIRARSHLYAKAGAKIANVMEAGPLARLLSWLPGDGSTTCLNSCGCRWMLTSEPRDDGYQDVTATWEVNAAKEHCEPRNGLDGCVNRDGHTEIVRVSSDVDIPPYIGVV
jgi:hypothetical protein